jgi:hypothetical protein
MHGFLASSNCVKKEHVSFVQTCKTVSPALELWHTRKPAALTHRDLHRLRTLLVSTELPGEPGWKHAIQGDAGIAIGIAVRQLQSRRITDPEIDLALSAVLACAISGDPAAAVVLSSALRRRSKKFEHCRELSLLWLEARF